ncbi:MAG: hypothetical protein ACREJF_00300 [Candidatus Methylomirabilales bacterium]
MEDNPAPAAPLDALLEILRKHGVTKFEKDGMVITLEPTYLPPEPVADRSVNRGFTSVR